MVTVVLWEHDRSSPLFRDETISAVEVIEGSVTDFTLLDRSFHSGSHDTVFHLGAQALVGEALADPITTLETNVAGTYRLLEVCRKNEPPIERIVIASSDKAYGRSNRLPYTEDMPLRGRHPYDVSKSCADLIGLAYATTYHMPVVITRCGNTSGPGDTNWSSLIPGVTRSLLNGEVPEVRSDGSYSRDYVHVDDVVPGYLLCAERSFDKDVRGQAFNSGASRPYTVLELVGFLQDITGHTDLQPRILSTADDEIREQFLASAKAHKGLQLPGDPTWDETQLLNPLRMLDDVRMFSRFATGLRSFLKKPLTPQDCHRLAVEDLRRRDDNFLLLLRRGVYENPRSPYRALLRWAGSEYGDVERMVRKDGAEAALERLHDAGVYVHLDEFKGRRPITRGGLELPVTADDFDNPLMSRDFEVASGGSTGKRKRLGVDLDQVAHDTSVEYIGREANGYADRPFALWRAIPPGSAGIKAALMSSKLGQPLSRWFSPHAISWEPAMIKSTLFMLYAVHGSRWFGAGIPLPQHVPLGDATPVAHWLANQVRTGMPVALSAPGSSAVRICMAAEAGGFDISGSVFRMGGEPITSGKVELAQRLGVKAVCSWGMSEAGNVGIGCPHGEVLDDMHVYRAKIAFIQRPKDLPDGTSQVDALYMTTLLPRTPKIMLNLETGDYGILSRQSCGCPLGEVGLDVHIHTLRSFDKLTTGGMHFLGSDILTLVEQILPSTYGGYPTDYQFVEQEQGDALSRVNIVVSTRISKIVEDDVVQTVLNFLGSRSRGDRAMANHWREGDTLRVVRGEPLANDVGKISPLRVLHK